MLNAQPQTEQLPAAAKYTVEHRGNCILVFGEIPISAFSALTKLAPENSIMDTQLARIAGCNLAMGLIEDTKALRASMRDAAIERTRNIYASTGLSDEAVRWIAVGERGSSSDAIFLNLTGIRPQDMKGKETAHPHDPDDLSRCRLLLKQVPELAARIGEMNSVSKEWSALTAKWEEMCSMMDEESPEWINGKGSAPNTYEILKECLAASARA